MAIVHKQASYNVMLVQIDNKYEAALSKSYVHKWTQLLNTYIKHILRNWNVLDISNHSTYSLQQILICSKIKYRKI